MGEMLAGRRQPVAGHGLRDDGPPALGGRSAAAVEGLGRVRDRRRAR
ncbi:MAG: hypothetical protein MZV64_11240 [Ignavibacteriales bacterium]|nr:hypothetical protein [Ignavibacteriales bacterium]